MTDFPPTPSAPPSPAVPRERIKVIGPKDRVAVAAFYAEEAALAEQQQSLGKTEKGQQQEPTLSRDATVRAIIADVARVAHWLLNDSGYTRKHAAQALADIARDRNDGAWSEEDLRAILGDAAALPRTVNLPPMVVRYV